MGRSLAGIVLCLGINACTAGSELAYSPWPEAFEAQTAVLVVHQDSRLWVYASDYQAQRWIMPDLSFGPDDQAEVELLLYRDSLVELGLTAGPVALDPEGLPIPTAQASFRSHFQGQSLTPWVEGAVSGATLQARIARDPSSLCVRWKQRKVLDLGAQDDNAFAISVGRSQVIMGSFDGFLIYIDDSGAQPLEAPLKLPIGSAVQAPDGELWFGGERGELWRGRFSTTPRPTITAARVSTSSSGQEIRWMVLGGGPDPAVYTLGDKGTFERYQGGQWEILHRFGPQQATKGGLASPEPDVVYAAKGNRPQVVRYQTGRVDDVSPPDLLDGFTALSYVPGLGVMAAAGQGLIFQEESPGQWRRFPEASISLYVYVFTPFEDGFLMSGALGYLAQYRAANQTFCTAEQLAAGAVHRILPFGDGLLLAEDVPISRDRAIVTILERR